MHTHGHFLLQALWSGSPLPVCSCSCRGWSVGWECWTVIFINETGWMSGALWGLRWALSCSSGSWWGEEECSHSKKKKKREWKREKEAPSLTSVALHTADRHTLFLQGPYLSLLTHLFGFTCFITCCRSSRFMGQIKQSVLVSTWLAGGL